MCDCEYPKVSVTEFRKARKTHQCGECGTEIKPGDSYRVDRCFLEDWYGSKTCTDCQAIVWWVQSQDPCNCLIMGELQTSLEEGGLVDFEAGECDDALVIHSRPAKHGPYYFARPSPWLSIAFEVYQERSRIRAMDDKVASPGWKARYQLEKMVVA